MLSLILQPLADFIIFLITKFGLMGIVFAMAIESASIPLPSEVIMPFSGYLVSQGLFGFWAVSLAGALGCLIGSVIAYALGYWGGETVVRKLIRKYGKYILFFEYELDEAEEWLRKHGDFISFTSRLLPIVRTFISLPAGIARINFYKFAFYTFVGSFIWSATLAYLGVVLGENWQTLGGYFHKFDALLVLIGLGFLAWYIKHKVAKIKKNKHKL